MPTGDFCLLWKVRTSDSDVLDSTRPEIFKKENLKQSLNDAKSCRLEPNRMAGRTQDSEQKPVTKSVSHQDVRLVSRVRSSWDNLERESLLNFKGKLLFESDGSCKNANARSESASKPKHCSLNSFKLEKMSRFSRS